MLKHVREKHPEARIPMGDKDQMVEEIDVKTDPRSAIEYAPEPMGQVRVSYFEFNNRWEHVFISESNTNHTGPDGSLIDSHLNPAI